jgi:hypothetical protein
MYNSPVKSEGRVLCIKHRSHPYMLKEKNWQLLILQGIGQELVHLCNTRRYAQVDGAVSDLND